MPDRPPTDRPLAAAGRGRAGPAVAIVWDPQCWWASQSPGLPSDDLDYLAAVRAVYDALWDAGIACDFTYPAADLSAYRLVLAPSLFLLSAPAAATLRDYVRGGGHLAVWYFSGIVDADVRIWPGGYPGPLADILGVRVEEVCPLPPGTELTLSTGDTVTGWRERIHLRGSTVEACYPDGDAAITRHSYGSGTAWYVSTRLDAAGMSRLLSEVTALAGVAPVRPGVPPGVDVVDRGGHLYVINHTGTPCEVPADGTELVTGQLVTGAVQVPPGGFAVVRQSP